MKVKDVIKMIEQDGWFMVRRKEGSEILEPSTKVKYIEIPV